MTSEIDPQFRARLSHWTDAVIARGRSPFRRSEIAPPLLTATGAENPDFVLWINKDSFMAGGVLLLGESSEVIQKGRGCAEALGLKHFGTWSPQGIALWGSGEEPRRVEAVPLPDGGDLESCRPFFEKLLEEFKLLSVLGTVPPPSLSPFYFANLARSAMESAFPCLVDGMRLAQGERRIPGMQSPSRLARRKTAMTALRLLALLAGDHLPPAVHPEGLERAMSFAIDALPPHLGNLLALSEEELPLPSEAAVRFHHLFRRLGQLLFAGNRLRAARTLEILLAHEGNRLGGYPLPDVCIPPGALLINPDRLLQEAAVEVAPAPLLALTSLIRELRNLPPLPSIQAESCFGLLRAEMPETVVGTLADRSLPGIQERQELSARLRSSWPNRRFPLPLRTPRWVWEFIHLLGLAGEKSRLVLNLPDGWLSAEFAPPLLHLIGEHFTLDRLERTADGLRFALRRESESGAQTLLRGPGGQRSLPWRRLREEHFSFFTLALDLPPHLFELLEDGRLAFFQPEALDGNERELFLFSRSSLGSYLWRLIGGKSLPRFEELAREAAGRGLPVPSPQVLEHLRRLSWKGGEAPPPSVLDEELARWLGGAAPPALQPPPCSSGPGRKEAGLQRRGRIAEEIARVVFSDGVPLFPEQYLYGYFRLPLQRFAFEGTLRPTEAFFGQVTLRDGAGALLTVEGEETARALEFASYGSTRPVELPRDRAVTAAIVDRYCADLRQLRQTLLRHCHLGVPDFRGAEALAHRIWHAHRLPPWPLFEG